MTSQDQVQEVKANVGTTSTTASSSVPNPTQADAQSLASATTLHTKSPPLDHVIDERRFHKVSSLKQLWNKKGSLKKVNENGADSPEEGENVKATKGPLLRRLTSRKQSLAKSKKKLFQLRSDNSGNISKDEVSKAVSTSSYSSKDLIIKKLNKRVEKVPKKITSESALAEAETLSRDLLQNCRYDDAMVLNDKILVAKKSILSRNKVIDDFDPRLGGTFQIMGRIELILVDTKPQRGSYAQALQYFENAIKCYQTTNCNNSAASVSTKDTSISVTQPSYQNEVAAAYGGIGDIYFQKGNNEEKAVEAYENHLEYGTSYPNSICTPWLYLSRLNVIIDK